MTAPRSHPGCPGWCTEHQDRVWTDAAGNAHGVHLTSRRAGEFPADIRVALAQAGQAEPRLSVGGLPVSLDDADTMAALMLRLGRDDVATAIRALAGAAAQQVTS